MNINDTLNNIWSQDYINNLPEFIKERGFAFSENKVQKDILITGINPSFRQKDKIDLRSFNFQQTVINPKWDIYWSPLKDIIFDPGKNIDLRIQSSYLDIFYFKEKDQKKIKNEIIISNEGVRFLAEQLVVTQYIIEEIISPKIIIVKNRESAAYWGKFAEKGIIWMGYQFDFIQSYECGELYKITGLINSIERVSPDIKETKLMNSYILFSQHINQFTKKEKRPTAIFLSELLQKQKHSLSEK